MSKSTLSNSQPATKSQPAAHLRIEQRFQVDFSYPVIFTRGAFSLHDDHVISLIENQKDKPVILPIIDAQVAKAQPDLLDRMANYFRAHDLEPLDAMIIAAGESSKHDDEVVQAIYQAVLDHKIDRHSYIVVVGGGAVIDCVGYAAATAHRGIRLIRIPTTVLAQNDAAVGVKNAINFKRRKNFLGTFVPPHAVVNDFDLLDSLEDRDKRAGIAEAIKVALIKDADFFQELYKSRKGLAEFEPAAMEQMIIKGAQWHLDHIANNGDPFEQGSSRPLDFGHWSAHKLEELSAHDLRHGEAVAIGIAMDSIYSHKMGLLNEASLNQILILLDDLGFQLAHPALKKLNVESALHEFKEHLGGCLCIMLLQDIGKGIEVDSIDHRLMAEAVALIQNRHAGAVNT